MQVVGAVAGWAILLCVLGWVVYAVCTVGSVTKEYVGMVRTDNAGLCPICRAPRSAYSTAWGYDQQYGTAQMAYCQNGHRLIRNDRHMAEWADY